MRKELGKEEEVEVELVVEVEVEVTLACPLAMVGRWVLARLLSPLRTARTHSGNI